MQNRNNKGQFKKGHKTWNKGKKMSREFRANVSKAQTGMKRPLTSKRLKELKYYESPRYKGDDAGYSAYHKWLEKYYGKANKCEGKDCNKKSKMFHWALIKGKKHSHKRENYMMLCASCHQKYDMTDEFREKISKHFKIYYKTHKHPMLGRKYKRQDRKTIKL